KSSARCSRSCAPRPMRRRYGFPPSTTTVTASPSSPATATPPATSQPASMSAWWRELRDPGAALLLHLRRLEALGLRRPQPARARRRALLHQDQDGDLALALGHQGRRRIRHSDDEVSARDGSGRGPYARGGMGRPADSWAHFSYLKG